MTTTTNNTTIMPGKPAVFTCGCDSVELLERKYVLSPRLVAPAFSKAIGQETAAADLPEKAWDGTICKCEQCAGVINNAAKGRGELPIFLPLVEVKGWLAGKDARQASIRKMDYLGMLAKRARTASRREERNERHVAEYGGVKQVKLKLTEVSGKVDQAEIARNRQLVAAQRERMISRSLGQQVAA